MDRTVWYSLHWSSPYIGQYQNTSSIIQTVIIYASPPHLLPPKFKWIFALVLMCILCSDVYTWLTFIAHLCRFQIFLGFTSDSRCLYHQVLLLTCIPPRTWAKLLSYLSWYLATPLSFHLHYCLYYQHHIHIHFLFFSVAVSVAVFGVEAVQLSSLISSQSLTSLLSQTCFRRLAILTSDIDSL